eukprot:6478249-Amphidinium_carterae.1
MTIDPCCSDCQLTLPSTVGNATGDASKLSTIGQPWQWPSRSCPERAGTKGLGWGSWVLNQVAPSPP